MSYEDFRSRFDEARNQYNVLALVGNGFDIQVLTSLGSLTDTRYESFYHFLKYRKFNPSNRILGRMESLRSSGAEDWSDVERAIGELHLTDRVAPDAIAADLKEVQREFANGTAAHLGDSWGCQAARLTAGFMMVSYSMGVNRPRRACRRRR